MKNNLKTKVMLAVLAGGMLCANGAFATEADFEITTNGKTSKTGDIYMDSDTIEATEKTYGQPVKGNVNLTDGTLTTNYDGNIIIFRKGTYTELVCGAWNNDFNNVTNNKLIIYGGEFNADAFVYGGYSEGLGTAGGETRESGNKLTINDGTFNAQIYGGRSKNGNAKNNLVTINNGAFNANVYGGDADSEGAATDNHVIIENGNFIGGGNKFIDGGYSSKGVADKNTVTIKGGNFSRKISGGRSMSSGVVTNNIVTIEGGTFSGDDAWICGGLSNTGNATGNIVNIEGGTFNNAIYGGNSYNSGTADNNIVEISGGTFGNGFSLYGGYTTGSSTNNTLNLKTAIGGTAKEVKFFQNVNFTLPVGATSEVTMLKVGTTTPMALADITFTTDLNGLALTGNDYITLVKGVDGSVGTFTDSDKYHVLTIGSGATAYKELVYSIGTPVAKGDYTIKQGGVKGDSGTTGSYTGSICGNTDGTGLNVTGGTLSPTRYSNNEVIIRRGTYSKVYGAYNNDNNTETSNNTVNVYDGTFESELVGGYAYYGGNANGNTVNFHGGKVTVGDVDVIVYGGAGTNATGNTVNIYDGIFEKTDSSTRKITVYAGYGGNNSASGNELNITGGSFNVADAVFAAGAGASGGATDNVLNISGGNFMKPANFYGGLAEGGNATGNTVTIKGGTFNDGFKLYGGQGTTSSGNILNLKTKITGKAAEVKYFQEMNFTLPKGIGNGDIMLKTTSVEFDTNNTTINVYAAPGVSLKKDDTITLINSTNAYSDAKFSKGTILEGAAELVSDNSKVLSILLLQDYTTGGDTATIKAVAEGVAASLAFVNQGADMVAGSGIDGLYVADSENPTIAAFSGNKTRYKTGSHVDIHGWNALAGVALNNKKSFSHGVFVEIGNGDIDTYAALNGSGSSDYKGGGYMLRKDMGKGWSIDGSVRAGRVETSWGNDTKGSYEAKQTYYGAHVTFNKMLKEYNAGKLNGYLRYTFTHLGSDSVNLDGTHYGFDSVNSHRTRLGARMVDEGQNGFELYYGAAWEYGFGGDCDATVNGATTSGPAVDGSNAVFEVGGTWSDRKWDISAGLEGYAGAKRGVAGGMNFIYRF